MSRLQERWSKIEMVALGIAVLAAAGFYWKHTSEPYSEPASTSSLLLEAVQQGDLNGFRSTCLPAYYQAFVSHFGEQKYRAVQRIFDKAYRYGEQSWREYRLRANELAEAQLRRLREKEAQLAKEAFTRLSVDERMRLIEDRAGYQKFLTEAGKAALPAEERRRAAALQAFLDGQETEEALQEVWSLLAESDRRALVEPSALANTLTPAKLAFIDSVGVPQLSKEEQQVIRGVHRGDLANAAAFMFRHGEPLAEAFLNRRVARFAGSEPQCKYPKEEFEGSYLRGDTAECTVVAATSSGPVPVGLSLKKMGWTWLVTAIKPELYQINW
jgi:hypothetical protein